MNLNIPLLSSLPEISAARCEASVAELLAAQQATKTASCLKCLKLCGPLRYRFFKEVSESSKMCSLLNDRKCNAPKIEECPSLWSTQNSTTSLRNLPTPTSCTWRKAPQKQVTCNFGFVTAENEPAKHFERRTTTVKEKWRTSESLAVFACWNLCWIRCRNNTTTRQWWVRLSSR